MDYIQQAKNWLAQDPDDKTRAILMEMLEKGDEKALRNCFSGRLQFGTAGLRGRLQPGPNGMNRVLVAQTAKGLADYLLARFVGLKPRVVIAYDARNNSKRFAHDSAEILQGAGLEVFLLDNFTPTPVLAFLVRDLNCHAGVMVTASHNPPEDNGYKVYLGAEEGGAQIVPPADEEIASCIDKASNVDIRNYARAFDFVVLGDEAVARYIEATAPVALEAPLSLDYVYTAMHGVGRAVFSRVLERVNYPLPLFVEAQCMPDGNFPTVLFPNPEEKGALDLAMLKADESGVDLILAHDPDADRLAVAMKVADKWRILHGNEVGCYLAWEVAKRAKLEGKKGALACSLVSSPLLSKIAAHYGLDGVQTLTGFKWISRVENLLFGYEEALGYLVDPNKVRDKDGISAALAFLSLMISLKRAGKSFAQYQAEFTELFGSALSGQVALRKAEMADLKAMMEKVRAFDFKSFAGVAVSGKRDFMQETPQNDILLFNLQEGSIQARLIFRPSGTEPKLKVYLDVVGEDLSKSEDLLLRLQQDVESLLADF